MSLSTLCIWLILPVLFAATGVSQDPTTLFFARQITLRNLPHVVLNSNFKEAVAGAMKVAVGNAISTDTFLTPPDVTIVARAWFTGNRLSVTAEVERLARIFDGWGNVPNDSLVNTLNKESLKELGLQPSRIEVLNNCKNDDEVPNLPSSEIALNNLTLAITTAENPEDTLISDLCDVLSLSDCSLITLNSVEESADQRIAHVTVVSSDRNELLLNLMNHLYYASSIVAGRIESVVAANMRLYSKMEPPRLTEPGTLTSCLSRFWYLTFLILLFPLVLLISQKMYLLGEISGKKTIHSMEWDIRGGIRYQDQLQSYPGGACGIGVPRSAYAAPHYAATPHGALDGQGTMWPNWQGTAWPQQEMQAVHYDPNGNWDYVEMDPNQQYYWAPNETQ